MSIGIRDWLFKSSRDTKYREVSCRELFDAAQDVQIRELAFATCINMIAGVIGKCEFRTYEDGHEIKGQEYYLWNVEPNTNQSSAVFLHKLISNLYRNNEALVVEMRRRGSDNVMLVVADEWQVDEEQVLRPNEYREVTIGDLQLSKTFREYEVMHFKLHDRSIKPVIDALYASYSRMIAAAMSAHAWQNGQHWKVKVSSVAQGQEGWNEAFKKMMTQQLKPFFESTNAVLPEFEGYSYEDVGGTRAGVKDTRDIRSLIDDIFAFTAKALMIPPVLIGGEVAGTQDAVSRWLTVCIDPLCDQLQEEIVRKRYGYDEWRAGNYLQIDTSKLIHFDLFEHAANIEKLVGAGYSYNDIQRSIGGTQIDEPWADAHFFTKNFDLAANFTENGGE